MSDALFSCLATLLALAIGYYCGFHDGRVRGHRDNQPSRDGCGRIEGRQGGKPELQFVRKLFAQQAEWRVKDMVRMAEGLDRKSIYNAVAYLTRIGQLRKLGYGHYLAVTP